MVDFDLFKWRKHLMHTGSAIRNLGPKTNGSSWIILTNGLITRLAIR